MVSQSRVSKLLKDLTYSESCSEEAELGSTSNCSEQSDSGVGSDCSAISTPSREDAFLERLRSFQTKHWFAKPVEISPIACARLGWRCIATNKLQCISCCEELLVDDSSLSSNAVIQQAHNPICKWPSNVVPNSITLKTESVLNIFSHNLQHMRHLGQDDKWRHVQIELPPSFDEFKSEYEDATAYLSSLSGNSDDEELLKKLILISIFGWKMCSNGKVLQCSKCSRRLSVNLISSAGNPFNPEQQHFYWCCWICPYFKEPPAWVKQLQRSRKSPTKSPRIESSFSSSLEDGAKSVRLVRNIFKDLE